MTTQTNNDVINRSYRLTLVEPVSAPEGMPEGNWCRYVVEHGISTMNCIRAGTLKEVTQHAEKYVEDLNSRTLKGYSTYAHRKPSK